MRSKASPILPLFRSEAQGHILATLFLAEDEAQLRPMSAVAEQAGVPLPTAHRELSRLIEAGIVTDTRVGRQRLVAPDLAGIYYEPLRDLLERAFGAVPVLARTLRSVEGIEAAAIYGSYAARVRGESGPAPRDIDLLVVGELVPMHAIYDACREAEQQLHREVNPTVLTRQEWLGDDNGFLKRLRERPLLPVAGTLPNL